MGLPLHLQRMKRTTEIFYFESNQKDKLVQWASAHEPCVILDSHASENEDYPNGFEYDLIIGVEAIDSLKSWDNSFEKLKAFHQKHQDWLLGYFSYDLKNELEAVHSANLDFHETPNLVFFVPKILITVKGNELKIQSTEGATTRIYNEILETKILLKTENESVKIQPRIHHAEYIRGVKSMLHHIQMGDIYEANFCQEFYADKVTVKAFDLYQSLMKTSPTPFSAYCNFENQYLMCASPERFIKKTGNHILSQPIKGTAKRGEHVKEDAALKENLYHSKKDRTENVMIVDLVRNDLSRTAAPQTVKVDELFGVYSFSNVHQMISTISCEMDPKHHFTDVIKNAFPMGSMTGAPKIMATKLIDKFESTKRGLYSGSVGYITPNGDFDFNVVIRSLQYNAERKYLSYMVGGAITHNSIPEEEYLECEVKAEAIKKVLAGG
tara:strand:+ start:17451 stop:18767 length:1317 start_codon:yes stop_codon:yes gene_type:complete